MNYIPTTDNERRERIEEWERHDLRKSRERFLDYPEPPPLPPGKKLINNPYGPGMIIVSNS